MINLWRLHLNVVILYELNLNTDTDMTHLVQNLFSIFPRFVQFVLLILNSILAVRVGYLLVDKMFHKCNCMGVMFCNTSPLGSSKIIAFP